MESLRLQLRSLFNLKRDEFATAFLMFCYLFLVLATYMVGKAVRDSLFISQFGALKLPYAVIGQALLLAFLIGFYIKLSHRVRHHLLVAATLLLFAANGVVLWWLARFDYVWFTPLLYIWVGIMGAIAPMQVWTVANLIFNTRQAKRLFGVIGSGGILGSIFGGYITRKMAPVVGTHNLLLGIAAFALIAAALFYLVWLRNKERMHLLGARTVSDEMPAPAGLTQSLAAIKTSRYLVLITAIVLVSSLATTVAYVQFSAVSQMNIKDPDRMTEFFGRVYEYLSWASFFLQFLLSGRIIQRWGVGVTIFVLPLSLLFGSVTALIYTTLWSAVLLRASDQVFRHSLDRSAIELLYLPVTSDIKIQVKSFIDTVVWRAGDGLGGVLLILIAQLIPLSSPGQIGIVNIFFIVPWLVTAYLIKQEYINNLRSSLRTREAEPAAPPKSITEPASLAAITKYLHSRDEQEALNALHLLEVAGPAPEVVTPHLRVIIHHPRAAVRLKALSMLFALGDKAVLPEVEGLLQDEDVEVRAEAVRYIYTYCESDPLAQMSSLLDYPDHSIQASVVVCLLKSDPVENAHVAHMILEAMIREGGERGRQARIEAAKVLGLIPAPSPLHNLLKYILRDGSTEVVRHALESAGKIRRREFVPLLIERLRTRTTRPLAREALVNYGDRVIGTLKDYLNDGEVDFEVRRRIPRVFSTIGSQAAADALIDSLAQQNKSLMYEVIKALNKLRDRQSAVSLAEEKLERVVLAEIKDYYRISEVLHAYTTAARPAPGSDGGPDLLIRALVERLKETLERIFRLLGLIYPPGDIYHAYSGLISEHVHLKANALEFLDNVLKPGVKKSLFPLIDFEMSLGGKVQKGRSFWHWDARPVKDILGELIAGPDRWLSVCALYAVGRLGIGELQPLVQHLCAATDPLLAETANWSWRRLQAADITAAIAGQDLSGLPQ